MAEMRPTEDVVRCSGCGLTKYGHAIAIEHMVASAHEWTPRIAAPVPHPAATDVGDGGGS